jgi:FkbM family methyltransferase
MLDQGVILFKKALKKAISVINFKSSELPGISKYEFMRLKNYKPLQQGTAYFFGGRFQFSDSNGFMHSVQEIFKDEVYKFKAESKNPLIIDCGSNIGLSLFYFIRHFPGARILAFEPDNEIYKMLESNIKVRMHECNIELRREAVWVREEQLVFFSEGSLAGSTIVDFSSINRTQNVKAIDLNKYLNQEIEFLKIDIEGAENELIFHISENLKNVKNLFLEYHGLLNQPQNLGEILNLISNAGFEYYIRVAGETIKFPFCNEKPSVFNQQLNIMCYRTLYN